MYTNCWVLEFALMCVKIAFVPTRCASEIYRLLTILYDQ